MENNRKVFSVESFLESEQNPDFQENLAESDLENSDDNLEIDLDNKATPCRTSSPNPDKNELGIIQKIEDEIGKQLFEKAEKTKLTVTNVKTIIRQVLTDENFKALLNQNKTADSKDASPTYELKLTRAKAKELFPDPAVPPPWVPQPPPSETHVLIGEDLKEDDSGDEYVPGEDESEDDRDESIASESDISSLPPPTPPTPVMEDSSTQTTNYTDDGVFKIPLPKMSQDELSEEMANIALRTRSKINLSATPLEVIEKSFVPPDITKDMYDMDCDDEEWKEFLKGFTEPLDVVAKPTEDDDHDPDYNILADDEINQVDHEDFRIDKAVKIRKKEIKELWEELFDYLKDISEEYEEDSKAKSKESAKTAQFEEHSAEAQNSTAEGKPTSESQQSNVNIKIVDQSRNLSKDIPLTENVPLKGKLFPDLTLEHRQICILEQQMRQHVQMLTQNFLLTYEHPEFHHYSPSIKEYLLNLKLLAEGKLFSYFKPVNLIPALNLIERWIQKFASNCAEVRQAQEHLHFELAKSLNSKKLGNYNYQPKFSSLILETISKSDVFLYPSLLPNIPFKSEQYCTKRTIFTEAEDRLLVFGVEQFHNFLKNEKKRTSFKNTLKMVNEYIMPHRDLQTIIKHYNNSMHSRCANNPIKEYALFKKIRPVRHYEINLNKILPPYKRSLDELPDQWRNFIQSRFSSPNVPVPIVNVCQAVSSPQIILINPQIFNASSSYPFTPIFPKEKVEERSCRTQTKRKRLFYKPNQQQINYSSLEQQTQLNETFENNQNLIQVNSPAKKVYSPCATPLNTSSNFGSPKKNLTSLDKFIDIFLRSVSIQKLVQFFISLKDNKIQDKESSLNSKKISYIRNSKMLPNMPSLQTPVKNIPESNEEQALQDNPENVTSTTDLSTVDQHVANQDVEQPEELNKSNSVSSSKTNQDSKKDKCVKNLEFSMISSTSFQQADTSTEVEFCRNSSDIQICQTSQVHTDHDIPSSSACSLTSNIKVDSEKVNPEDVNTLQTSSSMLKPSGRKEPSGAEKKKAKLKKEFLANLSIASPCDEESERNRNELFAIKYYDKLRESLELDDYNKIMEILANFESGDVIDLYKNVQSVLRPKYMDLAEEFLYFLKKKEAAALNQLIPWMQVKNRSNFLQKIEIYFKDQPAQLKKIYNSLMSLTQMDDISMEKVKSAILPLLKGNNILTDMFLQNFDDERPPQSLLEGPYETIDIFKEAVRPPNEEIYEKFVVPNTEDKYGGSNCVCHCHKIEDNEYKSRYKHCKSCGLRFVNGRPFIQSGRGLQPATVSFKTSPNVNHNIRLAGKSSAIGATSHKKKRSDSSPSKQVNSSGKENLDEDTEEEEIGKRKRSRSVSQKTPRKRKKTNCKDQEIKSPKKSPPRNIDVDIINKDLIKPRKRTYSGKRNRKEDTKKIENVKVEEVDLLDEKIVDEEVEVIEIEENKHETSEENQEKTDDCMDSSGESLEKPLTPGQHTAESESEIYCEESSQDNYESDSSSSSTESAKGSQSDSNTNDEPAWKREEDTIILETFQKEDDKDYALQIISDKMPNRTLSQIRARFSTLMALLIETLKHS